MLELRGGGGTRNHPAPPWPEITFCQSREAMRQDIGQEVRGHPAWCLMGCLQVRRIIMTGPNKTIEVLIPEDPGLHEFIYRWGHRTAHFDDETVEIVKISGGA